MQVNPVHIQLSSEDESDGEQEVKSRRRHRRNSYTEENVSETNTPRSCYESEILYKNPPWTNVCQNVGGESQDFGDYDDFSQCDTTVFDSQDVSDTGSLLPNILSGQHFLETFQEGSQCNTPFTENADVLSFGNNFNQDVSDCGSLLTDITQSSIGCGYNSTEYLQSVSEYGERFPTDGALSVTDNEIILPSPIGTPTNSEYGNMFTDIPASEHASVYSEATPPATDYGNLVQEMNENIVQGADDIMINPVPSMVPPPQQIEGALEVFPTLHISQAGLISVLLRHNIVVEMTVDRTIRVVDHTHKTVMAVSSRGDMSCLNHTAARLYNQNITTEADIFWDRHVKISPSGVTFASGKDCYFLHPRGIVDVPPNFMDLSNDTSVTLLFATSTYGPHILPELERLVQAATYNFREDGSFTVHINNVKIEQLANDDVLVEHERKSLHVSPTSHAAHVDTNYSELSIGREWTVKLKRKAFHLVANFSGMIISDGERECGFNSQRRVFIRPAYKLTETIIMDGQSVHFAQDTLSLPVPCNRRPPLLPPPPPPPPQLQRFLPHMEDKDVEIPLDIQVDVPVAGLEEVLRQEDESEEEYFQRLEAFKDTSRQFDDVRYRAIVGNQECQIQE